MNREELVKSIGEVLKIASDKELAEIRVFIAAYIRGEE